VVRVRDGPDGKEGVWWLSMVDRELEFGILGLILGLVFGFVIFKLISSRKTIMEVVRDENGRIVEIVEVSK